MTTLKEAIDRDIGKIGTPERDSFEMQLSKDVKRSIDEECRCEACGRTMTLKVIRKKQNRYDKGHFMYVCSCGNKFSKRTFNEVLRDLGEKE